MVLPGFSSRLAVRLAVVLALLSALGSALLVGGARSAGKPSGLIAFARADGIFVMHADGSGIRSLRRGGAASSASGLAWSPDGRKLAFVGAEQSIWVVEGDGSDLVRLAVARDARGEPSDLLASPTWSPDGRRIAFTAGGVRYYRDIWVMNADGSDLRRLARTKGYNETEIDWSPSGDRIAFSGVKFQCIHLVGMNGSVVRHLPCQMFGWLAGEGMPAWSPDGRRIAFVQETTPSGWERPARTGIFVMNVGDGSRMQLTRSKTLDVEPVWSPDGKRILFMRSDAWGSKNSEIYVMNADGTGVTRLTHNHIADTSPAWQPAATS